ncbi:hypothetical protein MFRU_012g01040 [Monilinia fructicola]|uniref:J domain-containing protein n=1 Tax=Monilinia fructicola TaxID=38448 RepID=A0A5M9JKQ4_MONFR|nr:hypothetical protein EYC84_007569 [Monilinia fructicola]KAG4030364.1 hypothetical protein MFRU_012g01040 [Monilinia fructicola]
MPVYRATPKEDGRAYYQTLGLDPISKPTFQQIKTEYRSRALLLHPDKNPSANAHVLFIALQTAYEKLSDEKLRAQFESKIASQESAKRTGVTIEIDDENDSPHCSHCCPFCGPLWEEPDQGPTKEPLKRPYQQSKRDTVAAAMEEIFRKAPKKFKQGPKGKRVPSKVSRKSGKNRARNAMRTSKDMRSMWDEEDTYYEDISVDEDKAKSAPGRLRGQKTKSAPKMVRG